jgi:hypothetical protein
MVVTDADNRESHIRLDCIMSYNPAWPAAFIFVRPRAITLQWVNQR